MNAYPSLISSEPEQSTTAPHVSEDLVKKLLTLTKKYRHFIVVGVGVFFFLLFALAISLRSLQSHSPSIQESQQTAMLAQLHHLTLQLDTLAKTTNDTADFNQTFASLRENVKALETSLTNVAQARDIQQVSSQLGSLKTDVDSKMSDLKNSIDISQGGNHFLDPKLLPYRVTAIDVIDHLPYVSINYADHIAPYTVGDSLVGWRLIEVNAATQEAEFENKEHQLIHITLPGS